MRTISEPEKRLAVRLLSFVFTLILTTISAQAYTVVLRSGRTVEIPDTFEVTKTAVVYEVSSGIQISLQLVSIDIPATERMNRESPGSFLRRAQAPSAPAASAPVTPAVRSITNKDLAPYKRSRQESEVAYERRRKELGLPSAQESRQRAAAESAALRDRFVQDQQDQKDSETYWRERAVNLRSDIAAADAEINSLRLQLDSMPESNTLPSFTTVVPTGWGYPYSPFGTMNPFQSRATRNRVFMSPNSGPVVRGRVGVGRRNVLGPAFGGRGQYLYGTSPYGLYQGYGYGYGYGYQPNDYSYDRTALMTQLNELIARRAGLEARWRALEEDARRSGAQPGWMR
jgi:hypothetical protein